MESRLRVCADPAPGVGPAEFTDALARLASGLAVVAGWREGRPAGLLVSSITGLSVDPPRFLFCVRREAASRDVFVLGAACGVSILSAQDEAEARCFIDPARRAQRFEGLRWRLAAPDPPVLEGSLSQAICRIDEVIESGTHAIVLVTAHSLRQRPGEPLVAFDRRLRRLDLVLKAADAA